MGNCIYRRKNYIITTSTNRHLKYIVCNTSKEFEDGHTHVSNYFMGKLIIQCCLEGDIPSKYERLKKNNRFIESIIRVVTNKHKKKFINILNENTKENTLP